MTLATRRALGATLPLVVAAAAVAAQVPTVTKEFAIGCAECGGALQFASISEVALFPDGRLIVADRDAPMVRVFDATGRPVWSGGTRGAGPGEYQYILRVVPSASGAMLIADMSGRRLTALAADGSVGGTTVLPFFATTGATDGKGGLVLGAEPPRGVVRVYRVRGGATTERLVLPELAAAPGTQGFGGNSVALSPSGEVAVIPNNENYQIVRLDASANRLPDLVRAIERVRRTPAEEAQLRRRVSRESGMVRSALEAKSGAPVSGAGGAVVHGGDLSLKPHFAVDGLRYDAAGRLWARTMRGDGSQTVFDVFAPGGEFLGSVNIAGEVRHFGFAGSWMVTSGEDADGVPQVTRWRVR